MLFVLVSRGFIFILSISTHRQAQGSPAQCIALIPLQRGRLDSHAKLRYYKQNLQAKKKEKSMIFL
jgi:hypothetical protein